jgi:hypothetical protein
MSLLDFFKPQPETPLAVYIILDGSGSMQSVKDDTIGGFNSYVEALEPETLVSLAVFNSTNGVETVIESMPAKDVKSLTDEVYRPAGMTPLYDAIGKVVNGINESKAGRVAIAILTDGLENASREYTRDGIRDLLNERQEKNNWLVTYLGANQDSFVEGGRIGTQSMNIMDFDPSKTKQAFATAGAATSRYLRTGNVADAAYTVEERLAAK